MEIKKIVIIFAILIGIMMIAQWSFFILAEQVTELEDEPIRISFHIVAEFLTAIALIIGGLGLNLNKKWGFSICLIALGMLSYTIVVSPGYYAQKGEIPFVAMFAVLWILTIIMIVFAIRKESVLRNAVRNDEQGSDS